MVNTTRNKTTEARSPRGSRLDYFRTLWWFVCSEWCTLPGNRSQKIVHQYGLLPLCIGTFTRREFNRAFGSSFSLGHHDLTIFPLFLCVQHLGKCVMLLPRGSLLLSSWRCPIMHDDQHPVRACALTHFTVMHCQHKMTQAGNTQIDLEQRKIIWVWKRPEMLGWYHFSVFVDSFQQRLPLFAVVSVHILYW